MPGVFTKTAIAAVLLTASMAMGACGGNSQPIQSETVTMREYEFSPRNIAVERGQAITVRNQGKIAHNLTIVSNNDPLDRPEDLIGTSTFLGGRSKRLRVDLPPGRYVMISSVPGQRQLGMHGTITVR